MTTQEKVFAYCVPCGNNIWKIGWIEHCKRKIKYVWSANAPEIATFSQIKGHEEISEETLKREGVLK
jgi:hypothetical protein